MSDEARDLRAAEQRGRRAVAKKANQLGRLVVEYVPVESIKPNSYNPNRQDPRDFELLLRSMREDGFTQPIVVQRATSEIVDGEHRWRGARQLGFERIPVVFVDMTAEQMRVATLRHNRARGSEDVDLAAQVLRDLRELGALDWAKDSLLMDDEELRKLIDDVPAPDALAGDEFNEAWAPTKNASGFEQRADEEVSMTQAARTAQDQAASAHASAGSNEERARIEQGLRQQTYRLVLMYQDADAEVVRSALQPKPADRIVELCRARLAAAKGVAGGEAQG